MAKFSCFNVPAHSCSATLSAKGRRIVQYEGNEYAIIGLYLARHHRPSARRILMYVLRPVDGDGQTGLLLTL